MKRDPLGKALREMPVPEPADAERRGRTMVEAAHAERRVPQRPVLPRLALAFSAVTLLAALLLSPAGAAVTDWVDRVVGTSAPRPEPGLAAIPGGGRLLVQSEQGPWVVQPDGSRRLLGDFSAATWSPRGLFVGVVKGRMLSALEPDGDPRWSITAPAPVSDARWSPSPGYHVAYRSGRALRVVGGDGSDDHLVNPDVAPVAPAWSPLSPDEVAYLDADGSLRIADGEERAGPGGAPPDLAATPAGTAVTGIEWGAGGLQILETSPKALHLQAVVPSKFQARPEFRARAPLPIPPGATVIDAALAPRRPVVAAVLLRQGPTGPRSTVALFESPSGKARRLLSAPGEISEVVWSPDGRRLLIAWADADQWLFLPIGRSKGRSVAGVSATFAPGRPAAAFPRIEGWCCPR